jgi:SAM-dependent methyltransferase
MFTFVCNICESRCTAESASPEHLGRETKTCLRCGSTVRFRWIVHALSMELFGKSVPLPEFPRVRGLRGIGMSETATISDILAVKLAYKNTFYHAEPTFDILHPKAEDLDAFDFVISSEVFEHVPPPVQVAFDNLARVLRPNGFTVFSVPWVPEGMTSEHFPRMCDRTITNLASGPVLVNRTTDGMLEVFENLVFHGGDGQTLEMRVFSKPDLLSHLKNAGFSCVAFAQDTLDYGIAWDSWSTGLIAMKGTRSGPYVKDEAVEAEGKPFPRKHGFLPFALSRR